MVPSFPWHITSKTEPSIRQPGEENSLGVNPCFWISHSIFFHSPCRPENWDPQPADSMVGLPSIVHSIQRPHYLSRADHPSSRVMRRIKREIFTRLAGEGQSVTSRYPHLLPGNRTYDAMVHPSRICLRLINGPSCKNSDIRGERSIYTYGGITA